MITFSKLGDHGRLGNQLFQYALLLGVADRTGHEIVLPRGTHLLGEFSVPEASYGPIRGIRRVYREPHYYFDPNVFKVMEGTDFLGYFQTERYFAHVADQVRADLTPASAYRERAERDMQTYRNLWWGGFDGGYDVVAVHVRRGDNVHGDGMDPAEHAKFIPLQPLSYYKNAIAKLQSMTKRPLAFIVFSNTPEDAEWCRKNLPLENAVYRGGPEDNPVYDFALMMLCDHKVVSNSTLSWWAAWLSQTPGIVTHPTIWFGPYYPPPKYDTKDLWPSSWTKVESI